MPQYLTGPDKVAIHDVFTPAMPISVINVSDLATFGQTLVVTAEWCRCHVPKKYNRVHTRNNKSKY